MGIAFTVISSIVAFFGGSAFYLRRRISREWIDLRSNPTDLIGKVIVITGGNAGLGFEAAKDFSRRGAHVVLGCRDMGKGVKAARSIQISTSNSTTGVNRSGIVECLELDLASLSSVRNFASEIRAKYPVVHALICNAGVWVPMDHEKVTKDGYEIHFGVNHLGHFLLSRCLTDHMAQSGADSRIIFVSSSLMKAGKIDLEKQDFVHTGRVVDSKNDGSKASFAPTAYCDSKLMNVLTCRHLAATLTTTSRLTTYSVCPGFCRSSLGRHVRFPLYKKLVFAPIMALIQRRAVQGAQNIIFATIEGKSKLENGGFYKDGKLAKEETKYAESTTGDAHKVLWELSEKLIQQKLK